VLSQKTPSQANESDRKSPFMHPRKKRSRKRKTRDPEAVAAWWRSCVCMYPMA